MPELEVKLNETERGFGLRQIHAGHAVMVVIARSLPHPIEEVWDALTDPGRLAVYLVEPEGDFRRGGEYRLPDNATGVIERCDPPRLLTVSWVPGHGQAGELEIRLAAEDSTTRIELRYASVRKRFVYADPGEEEWPAGPGWEFVLDRLAAYLEGSLTTPAQSLALTDIGGEDRELYEHRNRLWAEAKLEFDREHRSNPRR
ncbi:hypothetical protein BN1051_02477 [Arthrobacter saudimassiliensis]|uniref:Activator of Hsp90 ATPase homologue 1/2-like C-terminal domain-containing protein n=1 Tax=Arthrobacter saudimassiliensis TaxID=1461584 RepID=A0A078MPD5_9MICC|nr:hypothetical protein BN1051_02477 [Arthrobacter saudimassiliensis]